ncbi:MAG: ATP-binding cassette domain-containing protein, partial [Ignavibacteriaceae bacterium]|nr:ATP-binding cassette domain-containing protein [Ignavibacteriaceae bacterium]
MLSVNINSVSIINDEMKRKLLSDIKFEIVSGKIYTILGKNGSGKSTLIKALTDLLPKVDFEITGKVIFNSTNLLNTSAENIRNIRQYNIRYVFQDAANSL